MALTAGIRYSAKEGHKVISLPVESGVTIFDGALVGVKKTATGAQGRARNWTDADAAAPFDNAFIGIARVHNAEGLNVQSVTGDAGGTVEVEVDISGPILQNIAVGGTLAATDVGALIYASDENTFTKTATAGGNPVGILSRFITAALGDVHIFGWLEQRGWVGRE